MLTRLAWLAALLAGCEMEQSGSTFDELYAFVEDDLDFEPLVPPGSGYPPGTIVDGEEGGGLVVIDTASSCFLHETGLTTVTTEDVLNAKRWSSSKEGASLDLADTLLGAEISIKKQRTKSLQLEITSLVREHVTLAEVRGKALAGGLSDDCRELLLRGGLRVVLESVRVNGLTLVATTHEEESVTLATGNLHEYLDVEGDLHRSVYDESTILPQDAMYLGVRTYDFPLAAEELEALQPPRPRAAEPEPVEVTALWCCDLYDRPYCSLQQATPLDTPCQCDEQAPIGVVCEAAAPPPVAEPPAEPPMEPQPAPVAPSPVLSPDPCAIVPIGPSNACGANLSESLDANLLFICFEGMTIDSRPCVSRCHPAPDGEIDFCEDEDPCVNAMTDGNFCGFRLAPAPWADPNTLYQCFGRRTSVRLACTSVCVTGPLGFADECG